MDVWSPRTWCTKQRAFFPSDDSLTAQSHRRSHRLTAQSLTDALTDALTG